VFKESFHRADLEPGAQERYSEVMDMILGIQQMGQPDTMYGFAPTDRAWRAWAQFCLDILDWLGLKLHYDDYVPTSHTPWPHRYIIQDLTQALVMMGMFFPKQREYTTLIHDGYLKATGKTQFPLFDQVGRAASPPDRRTGVKADFSIYGVDPDSPFQDEDFVPQGAQLQQALDMMHSLNRVTRPILAKLYLAGIIRPAYCEPRQELVDAHVSAGVESHRPDKPDLYLTYSNDQNLRPPSHYVAHADWPDLLAEARDFAARIAAPNVPACFTVLRVWSAPHFYPLMIGWQRQNNFPFVDGVGRSWTWRFIPKDQPLSEWSIHNTVGERLKELMGRVDGRLAETGRKTGAQPPGKKNNRMRADTDEAPEFLVKHRGDCVLIGAKTEKELLKMSTAVTFALQTKPWLREVDLWKSFVNVELGFLESLDPVWIT
jgi:hypothetical protein